MRLFRLAKIVSVFHRYGLDEFVLTDSPNPLLRGFGKLLGSRTHAAQRGERLRLALESLGPCFVKFGQVLSTRPDLIPPDIAGELSLLQDRVPPFPAEQVKVVLEKAYGRPVDEVFASFDWTPIASASVAQVHFGTIQLKVSPTFN